MISDSDGGHEILMSVDIRTRTPNSGRQAAHAALRPATGLLHEQGQPSVRATPTGQETPVPPRPQYPFGFLLLERYCWW